MNKFKVFIVRFVLYSFLLIVVLSIAVSIYLLNVSLKPAIDRNPDNTWAKVIDSYPELKDWRDSLNNIGALRDTFVIADDESKLHAYYINQDKYNSPTALIIHGYTNNAIDMMMIARMYEKDLGYNVVVPDLRYAGQSSGDYIQMGWYDKNDMKRWIEVIQDTHSANNPIVVHGISMGAATTMMLAGDSLPTNVKAFVEDCGYTSVYDQFKKELYEQYKIPQFPILYEASMINNLIHGWYFSDASSIKQVAKTYRPIFFIHGECDKYVPTRMAYELFDAKVNGEKELWIAKGSKHAMSYKDHKQEYTNKVKTFLNKYIVNVK